MYDFWKGFRALLVITISITAVALTSCSDRKFLCEKHCEKVSTETKDGKLSTTRRSKFKVENPYARVFSFDDIEPGGCVCLEEEEVK